MTLFALAARLNRLPSELAAQLTVDEFIDLIAFAQIEREELDGAGQADEASSSWAALAGLAGPPPPDP